MDLNSATSESAKTKSQKPATELKASKPSNTAILPWIGSFLKPYLRQVIAAIVFLFIGSLAWLALGQGLRLMIDEGFVADNGARLSQIMLMLVAISTISSIAIFCRSYLMTWLGERVTADIRLRVYNHLLDLSPSFYAKLRTGEVLSRFTADSSLLQSVVGSSLSMAIRSGVTVIGGLLMMAITSFKLTGLVLLAVPLVLAPIWLLGGKVRALSRHSQDRVGDMGAYVDETLHEIHTVQAYSHEDCDRELFSQRVEAVMAAARQRIKYRSSLISLVMLLSIVTITLVTWLGAIDVIEGRISAGELSAFIFYAVMVATAVATISEVIGEIQRAAGAADRLIELLETAKDIPSPVEPLLLAQPVAGQLKLKQLHFAYQSIDPETNNSQQPSSEDKAVIRGLDLQIKAGERVALVGASGAGKSTLFELLQRFYQPSAGVIELDGIDISQLNLQELRRQYALVPQESVIFAASVLENVRYGRPDASEAEVIEACIAAKADEFISGFSQGYHSYLGERGVRLSGGQKQRIAIARAILADRPILLLDEATSALDAISEQKVKQALDRLMQNKTTLIIAHRLATVINADRIIVLDHGQVVASGTHQQLMQSNPLYQEFASIQLLTEDAPESVMNQEATI